MNSTDQSTSPWNRVVTLSRVSTKSQATANDIPAQKEACRSFAVKHDWHLVREYVEIGVSGFSTHIHERDVLQRIMLEAERKTFDILLLFMFDRLGRRDDEIPQLVEWFIQQGIEVWSVMEGQMKVTNPTDRLINYLSFWQSNAESVMTSHRVSNAHEQMADKGLYRGGKKPFGYLLVPSMGISTGNDAKFHLEIDPITSHVIKDIFNMVHLEGLGGNKIAQHLNKNGLLSPSGKEWRASVVNYILRNPVYKGHPTYGKTVGKKDGGKRTAEDKWISSSARIEELTIVDPLVWNTVNHLRKQRTNNGAMKNKEHTSIQSSKLLLVGFCKCGYCGCPMTTTIHEKSRNNQAGNKVIYRTFKYRCSSKAQGRFCAGQTTYAQNRIETVVENAVAKYLVSLGKPDLESQIAEKVNHHSKDDLNLLAEIKNNLEEAYNELQQLKSEVLKNLKGTSLFDAKLLNDMILEKNSEIVAITQKMNRVEEILEKDCSEMAELELLAKLIPKWREHYTVANAPEKKMMLSRMIESVTVYRDHLTIHLKKHIQLISKNKGSLIIEQSFETNSSHENVID